jgi:uncharacterized protein (TIGR01777 family)
MRVVISGASGLVGTALLRALRAEGVQASSLARPSKPLSEGDVRWDPRTGEVDLAALEGADAVVHLAGASIASGRWTEARKQLLRTSRVDATRNLVSALARMERKPSVLISASAVGYYGNRGDEVLTEASPPGDDFLARLAVDWEAEAARAEQHGIRVVLLRFGVILAREGGALERMLLPFRLGLGGRLGSGRQWMSWIALADAVRLIQHALSNAELRGPVNAVAPNPVTNAEFTKTLGRVLRRPVIFPVPAFALRLLLGELADALLLSSQRVLPQRLLERNYRFLHAELDDALAKILQS